MEKYPKESRASSLVQNSPPSLPCSVIAEFWVRPASPRSSRVLPERSGEPWQSLQLGSAGPSWCVPLRTAQFPPTLRAPDFSPQNPSGRLLGETAPTLPVSMFHVWLTTRRWQEDSGEFRLSRRRGRVLAPAHHHHHLLSSTLLNRSSFAQGVAGEASVVAEWTDPRSSALDLLWCYIFTLWAPVSCSLLSLPRQTSVSGSFWGRQDGIADRSRSAETDAPVVHRRWVSVYVCVCVRSHAFNPHVWNM